MMSIQRKSKKRHDTMYFAVGDASTGISGAEDDTQLLAGEQEWRIERLEDERNMYSEKSEQLQELLKSCSLELLEHQKRLILSIPAEDLAAELEDLQEQIRTAQTDREKQEQAARLEKMVKFWSTKQRVKPEVPETNKANLTPEQAIDMALKSMKASIQYFQDERDILSSKVIKLNQESVKKETDYETSIQELQSRLDGLVKERDSVAETCDGLRVDKREFETAMLKMANQMEDLENQKQELSIQCERIAIQLATILKESDEKDQLRKQEDEEILNTMQMMQEYIDELESERMEITDQVQVSSITMASPEKEDRTLPTVVSESEDEKSLDKSLDPPRALSMALDEARLNLDELTTEHEKLKSSYNFQENTVRVLQNENSHMKTHIEQIENENERLHKKLESQENALAAATAVTADPRDKVIIENLQQDLKSLEMKYNAQTDEIVILKQQQQHQQSVQDSEEYNQLNEHLHKQEAENDTLSARCAKQESQIHVLTQENSSLKDYNNIDRLELESNLMNLKSKVDTLEEALEKSRYDGRAQKDQITLLKNEIKVNIAMEEERATDSAKSLREMRTHIQKLEAERDELQNRCKSQEATITDMKAQNDAQVVDASIQVNNAEEKEENPLYSIEELKEYIEELEYVKQRLATKSSTRETAIALLEEQNELKDARVAILEKMVESLMTERQLGMGSRAAKWKQQLKSVPAVERVLSAVNRRTSGVSTPDAAEAQNVQIHITKQELFNNGNPASDNMSVASHISQ